MFCKNCGAELREGVKFCENCGEAVTAPTAEQEKPAKKTRKKPAENAAAEGQRISDNIMLGPDGKYRWVYELNLIKNPSIFFLVWKIFFFILLGIFAVVLIADGADKLLGNLKVMGIAMAVMTGLVAVSYLIYAAIMGGKYCVVFEMDEKGINHKQMPHQAKKAQLISALTVIAGLAGGRMSTVGVGLNAARTEMYSEFAKTRRVKPYPKRGLIKVNGVLEHNQVYAAKEDFEFVKDFIIAHCNNLKR